MINVLAIDPGVWSRIWDRITVKPMTECWLWEGTRNDKGYPIISIRNKNVYVTRLLLEAMRGFPLGSLEACHSCDTPACVNLNHLWSGTHRQNVQDMHDKNRANLTGLNLPIDGLCRVGHKKSGKGRCTQCRRRIARDWARRNRLK